MHAHARTRGRSHARTHARTAALGRGSHCLVKRLVVAGRLQAAEEARRVELFFFRSGGRVIQRQLHDHALHAGRGRGARLLRSVPLLLGLLLLVLFLRCVLGLLVLVLLRWRGPARLLGLPLRCVRLLLLGLLLLLVLPLRRARLLL